MKPFLHNTTFELQY